jgi:hypothetical protein
MSEAPPTPTPGSDGAAPAAGEAAPSAPAPAAAQAAAPASAGAAPTCPLSLDVLTANFRKHVDPAAPAPLRMMGAKGLVPMAPKEMATALFMLTFDADAAVRETAGKTAASLPDRILSVALRDETIDGRVLDWFAVAVAARVEYLEMIVLNAGTSDETIARIAATAPDRVTEIVAQNQLRILRHEGIVRALVANPATRPASLDNVTDFCVRSGLVLSDLPAFREARRRVLGEASEDNEALAAAANAAKEEAEAIEALEKLGAVHADGAAEPEPLGEAAAAEARRMSIAQQVMKLTIAKKIEWANKKGNKEVRTLLLRDPNKLVQMAVVQSPRITEEEIGKLSNSRVLPQEVLSYIYNNRQLTKNYQIKVNLVNNPKVPVAVAMRYLSLLRASELKGLAKNKNVPNAVANAARNLLEKKAN